MFLLFFFLAFIYSDANCLSDEQCVKGICRAICNNDGVCGQGQICENRLCQIGCRTDTVCSTNEACINKVCTNPCSVSGQCGNCADCSVVNHGIQCSCTAGYLGNPFVACTKPQERCNSYCHCDEYGVFCAEKCNSEADCSCGQTCNTGKCRAKCNPGSCPPGQLCKKGACMAGCRTNSDCSSDRSCINGQCLDPCARDGACGESAVCKIADHRVLCLCPDGFQGDPNKKCTKFECQTNDDCDIQKKCDNGKCRNPCLTSGTCGINAQCRVVQRQSQCSCPPGFNGNPQVECIQHITPTCTRNTCGINAVCREVTGGTECVCAHNCVGDPQKGCICPDEHGSPCKDISCGRNADCRVINDVEAECFCPSHYPNGDPYFECKFLNFHRKIGIFLIN